MRSVNRVHAALLATLVLAAAGVTAGVLPYPSTPSSRASEVTASGSNLRDGWDRNEPGLSPATLLGGSFGELFDTPVNGQIYAQPVVADNTSIGNTVIVATENDSVYSLDAATGAINWQVSLGTPWPAKTENCTDLAPNVGVTGTPVYDPSTGTVYMVSQVVPPGNPPTQPAFYLDALNVATGAEQPGWPVQIKGAPTNDPTVAFNSFTELQRPGLLMTDGSVYAGFGSHCDFTPYEGYVVGVNTTSKAQTMWSDEAGPADTQAGIWQSGGGLLSDGSGQIIFASGNGISPAPGPGNKPPSELAESVVRLAVQSDGSLLAKDFFSPANAPYLDSIDGDLGSGGPTGLPFGTAAFPNLMVVAGKVDGLFVLNRNSLGGREQGPGNTDSVVSEITKGLPGEWGHPAAFADTPVLSGVNVAASSDYLYYLGKNDVLRYLRAGLTGTTPVLSDVAHSSDTFGYTSGSPVVTSNGASASSGLVWVVKSSDDTGATGALETFPTVPGASCTANTQCTVDPLWSFPLTGVGKFTVPATDSGRVYVATRGLLNNGSLASCGPVPAGSYCGQVYGFGSPSSAPLTGASPVTFGSSAVGGTPGSTPVTITNTSAGPVTIGSVTASSSGSSNPFAESGPYVIDQSTTPQDCTTSPAPSTCVLKPGDTLTVSNVTFTPAGPGSDTGSLQFHLTGVPNFPVVNVSLSGTGTQPGFYASTSSVNFGSTPVGTTASAQLIVTNGDASAETLTAPLPGSPFTVTGLPAGTAQPGQSYPLTITYHPAVVTSTDDKAALTLEGSAGDVGAPAAINLDGAGVADIIPTLTGTAGLSFGSIPLGQQATKIITVTNTGNLPAVITSSSSLSVPYGTPSPIAAGLPVTPGPGYVVHVPVTFTPTSVGMVDTTYRVTWTDAAGTHQLLVPVTGAGVAPTAGIAVPPPGGGWTLNGSAYFSGTALNLTPLVTSAAGSAIYCNPVSSSGLTASFTVKIGGGTGADGMTLSLLDASKVAPTAFGGSGGELGFGGLPGVAVTLDTSKDGPGYPSSRFIGIATGVSNGLLTFAGTATNVPALRTGTHVIGVSTAGGKVTVTVDGKQYLSKSVTLPKNVLVGFTGGTGSNTDYHTVTGVSITAGGHQIPPPGGGWSYNSAAGASGPDAELTRALPDEAGSVVYSVPVQSSGLNVTFNAQLGRGTGGDGLTFALLKPGTTTATTVGGNGTMLGLGTAAGVAGIAVVLGTDGPASDAGPPADFVATSRRVVVGEGLKFQSVAHGIGSLVAGTHTVRVTVVKNTADGYLMTVWMDGVQILQEAEPTLTPTVRLAFTAGTDATRTNLQEIRDVAIATSR